MKYAGKKELLYLLRINLTKVAAVHSLYRNIHCCHYQHAQCIPSFFYVMFKPIYVLQTHEAIKDNKGMYDNNQTSGFQPYRQFRKFHRRIIPNSRISKIFHCRLSQVKNMETLVNLPAGLHCTVKGAKIPSPSGSITLRLSPSLFKRLAALYSAQDFSTEKKNYMGIAYWFFLKPTNKATTLN